MALWEYKVITSGKGGFASPALLEKFLNDLGRDEWEIISFHTAAENFLAFTGLVRRPTQRDWTLEDAAAAAAKVEAEKLRAEFEAKFKAANQPAAGEERAPSFLEEKVAPDDGFRKPVDTSHDAEPDDDDEVKADEWDKLVDEEDELPTFFEAIKPHMRRNQRGPGMSVGIDYLAKKWDQSEEDLKGALQECGFVMPADEDAKAEYVEYDGDLYWINVNRRGELWINTKEKPRPVFRPVKAQKVVIEEPAKPERTERPDKSEKAERSEPKPDSESKSEAGERKSENGEQPAAEGATETAKPEPQQGSKHGGQLPQGAALLDKIRPHMRRNRRGPGGSGSASFLSRALRTNEAELKAAFSTVGLTLPSSPNDKPVYTEIGREVWWLNLDSRGGLWINGREKKDGETLGEKDAAGPESADSAPGQATTEGQAPEAPVVAASEAAPGSAAPEAVPAPEIVPAIPGAADAQSASASVPAEVTPPATQPTAGSTVSEAVSVPQPTAVPPEVPAPSVPPASAPAAQAETQLAPAGSSNVLATVRPVLKETKTGSIAGRIERVAEELNQSPEDMTAALLGAGLKIPEKPREKPVFVEHAGEIFWFNKNAKGELWLNAKESKFADKAAEEEDADEGEETDSEGGEGEKKPGRRPSRARGKKAE